LNWDEDGRARPPRAIDVREATDRLLRPAAQQLRIARKDQEYCRQAMLTLFRMVPPRRVRRSTKRSILRRECLPDVLWMLGALADEIGGEFGEALEYWQRAAKSVEPPKPVDKRKPAQKRAPAQKSAPARRGPAKKRRPRGRRAAAPGPTTERGKPKAASKDRAPGPTTERSKPKAAVKDGALPPPWDDDYFFAALPSVPGASAQDAKAEPGVTREADEAKDGKQHPPSAASPAKGKSRRRRRPKRGRGASSGAKKPDKDQPSDK
jgi:hypothetical protein